MFHKFNNLTGRLVGTDQTHPANGISPLPPSTQESPKIIYESSQVKISNVSTLAEIPRTPDLFGRTYSTVPDNIRQRQIIFQAKNDLPVFLKGGGMDRGLYGITMILCVVGLGGVGKLVYDLGFTKKA